MISAVARPPLAEEVVALAAPDLAETEMTIERQSRRIAFIHLEMNPQDASRPQGLEMTREQAAGMALSALVRGEWRR